jgi:hypothetical protein
MNIPKELAQLRAVQKDCATVFRDPSKQDWCHKEGAMLGVCDFLLEECLILIDLLAEERL